MFGFSRKSKSSDGNEDRLAEWQRSPSVSVTKATGLKTRLLLGNLGKELKVVYRNEALVIRPQSVFRKPAYNRMYVEAECQGETRILNIADLMIRRPDSDSYYDDDEPTARRSSLPALGVLVVLLALGGAAAIYFDVMPGELGQWLGKLRPQPVIPGAQPEGTVNEAAQPPVAAPATQPTDNTSAAAPMPPPEPPPAPATTTPPAVATEDLSFGREFSDATGGFRVRAEFVEFQPDRGRGSRVILRKADGSQIDVAMNRLSKEDQAWIRDEVKRRKM